VDENLLLLLLSEAGWFLLQVWLEGHLAGE